MKIIFPFFLWVMPLLAFAEPLNIIESSNNKIESSNYLTAKEISTLKAILAERGKLESNTGVLGSAPKQQTISTAGVSLEETQTGPQVWVFWTQTLANGLYYEGQLYAKYNMRTQNPAFPDVPVSSENNPWGSKEVFKLGYDFHVLDDYEIISYLRLEHGNNITITYQDNNGNYIHSYDVAILPGFKQVFKLLPKLTPYIDIWGGIIYNTLTGMMTEGSSGDNVVVARVNQYQLNTEFGFAYKITSNQSIIPSVRLVYTSNDPDPIAAKPYNQGGFNISGLSSSQQVYTVKYAYSF